MTPHRKNRIRGAAAALALVLAPAPLSAGPAGAAPAAGAARTAPAAPAAAPLSSYEMYQLEDAISLLVEADEDRTGYTPAAFPHWNAGRDPEDLCDTRREVLLAEALEAPDISPGCTLSGGRWHSYYDNQSTSSLRDLAVVHAVPLPEAWGSGARNWTAERREAYANDQGATGSLNVVLARTARERDNQNLNHWHPPSDGALCRYAKDWVATKLRWGLNVDKNENEALKALADNDPCESVWVIYRPAPA
ncbi:HNH endonuclease [Streptomyces sp. NPDC003691]